MNPFHGTAELTTRFSHCRCYDRMEKPHVFTLLLKVELLFALHCLLTCLDKIRLDFLLFAYFFLVLETISIISLVIPLEFH